MPKKTLVLGASENPARYSFLAVHQLRRHGHPVLAVGKKTGNIDDVPILTEPPLDRDIDTVSIYLNPTHQKDYYNFILTLKPKRIVLNPGAENPELTDLAKKNGIFPMDACTLVLLSTGQF